MYKDILNTLSEPLLQTEFLKGKTVKSTLYYWNMGDRADILDLKKQSVEKPEKHNSPYHLMKRKLKPVATVDGAFHASTISNKPDTKIKMFKTIKRVGLSIISTAGKTLNLFAFMAVTLVAACISFTTSGLIAIPASIGHLIRMRVAPFAKKALEPLLDLSVAWVTFCLTFNLINATVDENEREKLIFTAKAVARKCFNDATSPVRTFLPEINPTPPSSNFAGT